MLQRSFIRKIKLSNCVLALKKKIYKIDVKVRKFDFFGEIAQKPKIQKNPLNFNLTQTFSRAIKPHGPILKT